jgi:subtilase family serine protease
MHDEMQFRFCGGERGKRALAKHLRFVVWLPLVAALCAASAASAMPMRPAVSGVPFSQISDAAARAALQTPLCPTPTGATLVCYSPAHLSQAYDFPTGRRAPTGAGQTIVIVTAYGSPFIQADLAQFDAENGLPAPPSYTALYQQIPVSDQGSGDLQKWAIETSLDVEYAHAMAPGANIVLAVANTDDTTNVAQVEREVLPQYPGAIVTQSFGVDEAGLFSDPDTAAALDKLYLSQVRSGGTVVAASGDFGASGVGPFVGGPPVPMAGYPAASPFVLSVGGTMGLPFPQGLWNAGVYGGEQAWSEPVSVFPGAGAGGGAPSVVYRAPFWQRGMTGSAMRAEPDVSYNAAFNGGVVVVFHGKHGVVGGTSAGAPQWAAIIALANEVRGKRGMPPLGLATPQLWLLARDRGSYRKDFHDITVGSNALGGPGSGLPGFDARPGYDFATGLGTPEVSRLLKDLSGRDGQRSGSDDQGGGSQQQGDGSGDNGSGSGNGDNGNGNGNGNGNKHMHFSAGG